MSYSDFSQRLSLLWHGIAFCIGDILSTTIIDGVYNKYYMTDDKKKTQTIMQCVELRLSFQESAQLQKQKPSAPLNKPNKLGIDAIYKSRQPFNQM
jgi:hypothetical protein